MIEIVHCTMIQNLTIIPIFLLLFLSCTNKEYKDGNYCADVSRDGSILDAYSFVLNVEVRDNCIYKINWPSSSSYHQQKLIPGPINSDGYCQVSYDDGKIIEVLLREEDCWVEDNYRCDALMCEEACEVSCEGCEAACEEACEEAVCESCEVTCDY